MKPECSPRNRQAGRGDVDFQLAVERFVEHLSFELRRSRHTIHAYAKDLEQLKQFFLQRGGIPPLADLGRSELRLWLADESQRVSSKTLARKLSSLRAFFSFLVEVQAIDHDPAALLKMPKLPKHFPLV
ncbi:MAG: site-specific integrase [Polyangiaceae bacterium]|nr:site-specific integrase [Polyangiaceae bacterium]